MTLDGPSVGWSTRDDTTQAPVFRSATAVAILKTSAFPQQRGWRRGRLSARALYVGDDATGVRPRLPDGVRSVQSAAIAQVGSTATTNAYRAVTPSLATLPDSMLIAISSPYRKAGLLYKKWKTHFGKDTDDVLVIQASSTPAQPDFRSRAYCARA
jgi:hypothetical protein